MTPLRPLLLSACAALALVLAAPAASAHDYEAGGLRIAHPWTRATVGTSRPAVAYMTITNRGAAPERLLGAETPAAGRTMLHETVTRDGVARMVHVGALEIPGGSEVKLAPGGHHLMLMGLVRAFAAGEMVPLTLVFERAGRVVVELKVEPLGGGEDPHAAGH